MLVFTMPSDWAGFQASALIAGLFSHLHLSFYMVHSSGDAEGKPGVGSGGIRGQELGSEVGFCYMGRSKSEREKQSIIY